MKKLNTTITMKNVKASLNINIGEISFKEESTSTRKAQDSKRVFNHKIAKDIKLSLNTETEEIVFDIEALNDTIKEAVKDTVKNIEEVAEPVEGAVQDTMIKDCEEILRRERKIKSNKEYIQLLDSMFGYQYVEGEDIHSPEALLRNKCKRYLIRKIREMQ